MTTPYRVAVNMVACRCWLVAGVVVASSHAERLVAQEPVTAFTHVTVVPMDRERLLADQTVLVQRDRIIAMGSARQIAIPRGAQEIDGRGKFLIPGLVDMHAHLTFGTLMWSDADTAMAKNSLTRYVASGVTTVRDMWGNRVTLAAKAQVASGAMLGPRIYASVRPGFEGMNYLSEHPAEAVRRAKQAGFDFIKFEYAPEGEALDSILAATRQVGMPIAGHAPGPPMPQGDNLLAIKEGYRSVEHLLGFWSKADTTALNAAAPALKRAGVWACPTLAHVLGVAVPGTSEQNRGVDSATLYHATKVLHDAGVGLLAGTDALLGPRPAAGHPVTDELVALVAAGLSPYEALATATRNPALYFGTLDSVGTVAVGKRADLVLIAGNPLTDIRQVARQAGVMVRGRWVPRDTLDSLVAQLPK